MKKNHHQKCAGKENEAYTLFLEVRSKCFEEKNSYCLFLRKGSVTDSVNDSVSDKAVCRSAPVKPGLIKTT